MVVTAEEKQQIAQKGFADIGGTRKKRYWTPDGREMFAVPLMKDWVKIKDKKIIGSGTRDANLDKGWLLESPSEPKPYCPYCTNWHDTQKEIDACGVKKNRFAKLYEKKALKEKSEENKGLQTEVAELKSEMSDIKSMLTKLLEK